MSALALYHARSSRGVPVSAELRHAACLEMHGREADADRQHLTGPVVAEFLDRLAKSAVRYRVAAAELLAGAPDCAKPAAAPSIVRLSQQAGPFARVRPTKTRWQFAP